MSARRTKSAARAVYTIGHSTHGARELIELLRARGRTCTRKPALDTDILTFKVGDSILPVSIFWAAGDSPLNNRS